jgi:hypothetical protein
MNDLLELVDSQPALTKPMPSHAETGPPTIAWLCLAIPCLLSDFLMVPALLLMDGKPPPPYMPPIALGIVGCTLAQGNLLAAWLVLSSKSFARRLTLHWGIAAGLYSVWRAGANLASFKPLDFLQFEDVRLTVLLLVPLISLAAQFPFWIVRCFFGWRLVRTGDAVEFADAPLRIRDLMLATILVALTLALVRIAPPSYEDEFWGAMAVWSTVTMVISTIAMLPAAAVLMRVTSFNYGLAVAGTYAGSFVALIWLVVGISRWQGLNSGPPYFVVIGASCLILSFAATVTLAANVARSHGYRLAWGRGP